MRLIGWPQCSLTGVLIEGKLGHTETSETLEERPCEDHADQRGLRRSQTTGHRDVRLPASRTEKTRFCGPRSLVMAALGSGHSCSHREQGLGLQQKFLNPFTRV